MPKNFSVGSKIHKQAAAYHQACADYHLQAAKLIDKNNLEEARIVAKNAIGYCDKAHKGSLAACVGDMPWDSLAI